MTDTLTVSDAEGAAQLIAFGMRPRQHPSQDAGYETLVRRYHQDDGFQLLTARIAAGLGLRVVKVTSAAGAVLAAAEGSVFETRMEDYARFSRHRGDGEKVMHGIIHLAVATLVFPRPADLADDGHLGRVTATVVDQTVREICRKLKLRADESGRDEDAPSETPELERAWRAYARRPPTATTKDDRAAPNSTSAMISRALRFLTDQGLLVALEDPDGETIYRGTPRYAVQIRELASTAAFAELLSMGVVPPITDPGGTLRVTLPPARTAEQSEGGGHV
ncbi:hypothetical protein [Streptomyces sp. FH025]|uniref:hypothetical protein n=1 Tax=Streptomyces sp. FH025 TaxID=2815937 RepID=UPI001A9DF441|nr:hypothetical protein [Streptomyces sp. FH025]MBO1415673.1 hypothetical protein [Streptomyces sp. FH025]